MVARNGRTCLDGGPRSTRLDHFNMEQVFYLNGAIRENENC